MVRIHFTMSNGAKYTLSRQVYGGSEPLEPGAGVSSQLSLAMQKLAYFAADDGTILMTSQIATARIDEKSP